MNAACSGAGRALRWCGSSGSAEKRRGKCIIKMTHGGHGVPQETLIALHGDIMAVLSDCMSSIPWKDGEKWGPSSPPQSGCFAAGKGDQTESRQGRRIHTWRDLVPWCLPSVSHGDIPVGSVTVKSFPPQPLMRHETRKTLQAKVLRTHLNVRF